MDGTQLLRMIGLDPKTDEKLATPTKPFRTATIPNSYNVNSGWPTLLFDGETVTGSKKYPCVSSYSPHPGDRVVVAMFPNSGLILGRIPPPSQNTLIVPWTTPTYANGYTDYGSPYGPVKYTKTSDGMVVIKGLCTSPASGMAATQTIFQLPAGYRPANTLIFATSYNNGFGEVRVDTSGNVTTGGAAPAASVYISLNPIHFLAEQ